MEKAYTFNKRVLAVEFLELLEFLNFSEGSATFTTICSIRWHDAFSCPLWDKNRTRSQAQVPDCSRYFA